MRWLPAAAILGASATALAHGRPPVTNNVQFRPGAPHVLYVGSTFGLLVSDDDGCTFHWICEENVGFAQPYDPDYAIGADGTIFATTDGGLRISRDGGCSFQTALAGRAVQEVDIGPTGDVWIVTGEIGAANDVYVSTDSGATFEAHGLASTERFWKTVTVAPSNPDIIYVAGYEITAAQPRLVRTTDHGAHWLTSPLTGVAVAAAPRIEVRAIDPATPDIVYLVSREPTPGTDQLYRSIDGGQTFAKVLEVVGHVHDVLVTGTDAYVTTDAAGKIGGPAFHSIDGGVTFAPLATAPQLGCLGRRSDGALIGCGPNWDPDFMAVGRSDDGGATFHKVWRFVELAGPVSCPAGTVEHDTCDALQWAGIEEQFGATGPACGPMGDVTELPAERPPGGGCCDANSAPAASALWAFGVLVVLRRRR